MTSFIYHRLSKSGAVPHQTLVRALGRSLVRRTSLCEALVALDVAHARAISLLVHGLGSAADEDWRPDPRLVTQLVPGMCEQWLAFPFCERAGKVEVACVCPDDLALQHEFQVHLGRPVVLLRARLQALLAAANAPIDFSALARFLSQPPPTEEAALPLLRKTPAQRERRRPRTPTSPGLGRTATPRPSGAPPASVPRSVLPEPALFRFAAGDAIEKRMAACRDVFELAAALGHLLPAPALLFEIARGRLYLRATAGPGSYEDVVVDTQGESGFKTALDSGSYFGPFYDCPAHDRFSATFPTDGDVFMGYVGRKRNGLLTVTGAKDAGLMREVLDLAQRRYDAFS